jgi:RNA polymerase sigma-70 factor (ECF subfamily)
MTDHDSTLESLMRRAVQGDQDAWSQLLEPQRPRLRRMVDLHMDHRLAARFDSSDVVQEALTDAVRKLPMYFRDRPLPFYPWLRQLTRERLIHFQRRHMQAQQRSVAREEGQELSLADESVLELADRILARGSSPSARLRREEDRARVHAALDELSPSDREILVLRHLEQLSPREIADVLGVSEPVVYTRHLRALERMRRLLGDLGPEEIS